MPHRHFKHKRSQRKRADLRKKEVHLNMRAIRFDDYIESESKGSSTFIPPIRVARYF